jgi:hypothetical protein
MDPADKPRDAGGEQTSHRTTKRVETLKYHALFPLGKVQEIYTILKLSVLNNINAKSSPDPTIADEHESAELERDNKNILAGQKALRQCQFRRKALFFMPSSLKMG